MEHSRHENGGPEYVHLFEQAMEHHKSGRFAEADSCYRQVLTHEPNNVGVLQLLGVLAYQRGKEDIAVDLVAKAVRRTPTLPEIFNRLGTGFRNIGRLSDAERCFRRATELNPDYAEALLNLRTVLRELLHTAPTSQEQVNP